MQSKTDRRSHHAKFRFDRLQLRGWFAALMAGTGLLAGTVSDAAAFEDTIAQRAMACTGCHGKEGRAASDGYYPRIAGKTAG